MSLYVFNRVSPSDAEQYAQLRRRMLTGAPWAFASDVDNDRGLDVEAMRESLAGDRYAIFAAWHGEELAAAVGLFGPDRPKHAHRASIWGMWVDVKHRGRGLSNYILREAIFEAWRWGVDWVDLGVSERATGARQLYESHGFVEWGRQPEALEVDGARYDESFMSLPTPGPAEQQLRRLLFSTRGEPGEAELLRDLEWFVPEWLRQNGEDAPSVDGFDEVRIVVAPNVITVSGDAFVLPGGLARVQAELTHDGGWLVDAHATLVQR